MALVAVITHENGMVAPVDDSGRHFDAVKLYETESNERAVFPFDPKAADFDLLKALSLAHVNDVIGQHFEEACFNKLKSAGFHLWLEAPGFTALEALTAYIAGELPEAVVGAHVIQGAEGRSMHLEEHTPVHTHQMSSGSEAVITPMRSGKGLI